MGDSVIDQIPSNDNTNWQNSGGQQDRQDWVRANFTQIFGVSAEDLQARGVNPRQYARDHRVEIRRFAQMQRSQGIAVPRGAGPGGGSPSSGPNAGGRINRRYAYGGGGGGFGMGMRGGTTWIGILVVLLAIRFLLVDSFAGPHVAVFWVLGIGGVMLIARVVLFSWLRRRRMNQRQSGGQSRGQPGF
jgi:hypothetical protein